MLLTSNPLFISCLCILTFPHIEISWAKTLGYPTCFWWVSSFLLLHYCYCHFVMLLYFHRELFTNIGLANIMCVVLYFAGIDFKIKTVELGGKKIKLQIWYLMHYYYNYCCFSCAPLWWFLLCWGFDNILSAI